MNKKALNKIINIYDSIDNINDLKKYKLTQYQLFCIPFMINEYIKNGETKTIDEKLSNLFKKCEFDIELDFHKINYIIK